MADLPSQRLLPALASLIVTVHMLLVFGVIVDMMMMMMNVQAQNTTDPSEARILNDMFVRWGFGHITGDPCDSAVALNIQCNCSLSGTTTCHIVTLNINNKGIQGQLPEELWNLTYLTALSLVDNNLTGLIPASIGNLRSLMNLNIGYNALSGELPREFGLLANLETLLMGSNNFSGHLPSELGNLTRLTDIIMDVSGLTGPIPRTFSNVTSLQRLWMRGNELTGQIPEFIGNWPNLLEFVCGGNSFQGPIPPSFSKLVSLTELRISDLLSRSSSLDFLENMTSLSTLVLRNNNFSGAIPPFLNQFQRLVHLDLSFNSLTGTIPPFLFSNLSSLNRLFLGSNLFTGGISGQRSSSLQTIDLSYNQLSGSLPSWANSGSQINLVGNNISSNSSANSGLPFGLDCLQRNFPCNRESPTYSSFAINSGGPEIKASDQLVYERDTTYGPAIYYVTNARNWAVSNVGFPLGRLVPEYNIVSDNFINTSDIELFQTARLSFVSLRYYGLGLVNGNYIVRLQFSEIEIHDTRAWRSPSRRLFDIYIQGNLKIQDFDIQREAGEMLFGTVLKEFTAQVVGNFVIGSVTENYLEIHLFWAGKGSFKGSYGPIISTISATRDFNPPVIKNRKKMGLIMGIAVAFAAISLFSLVVLYYVHMKRKRQRNLENDDELLGIDVRPNSYSYAELKAATDDFNPANKLGEGGFGSVYKGTLGDGRLVAVKQLSIASRQGKSQFIAEIATISAVQHKNLVKLYGYCIEGVRRLLVYEYLENKSLDQLLFRIRRNIVHLEWPKRFDICMGVARGLAYLHEESQVRIVHRDVKASNILLDSDFNPKISDFGLAKLFDDKKTHISTKVAGTRGYLAPEYAMLGHLTEKADIFSFGVVALEMISGRPNSDLSLEHDKIYLLEWAWNLHERERQIELVDPTLCEFDDAVVRRVISIGLLCTQSSPILRPSMSRVVSMLAGDIEVPSITSTRPSYLTNWRFDDSSTPKPEGRDPDVHTGTSDPSLSLIYDGR